MADEIIGQCYCPQCDGIQNMTLKTDLAVAATKGITKATMKGVSYMNHQTGDGEYTSNEYVNRYNRAVNNHNHAVNCSRIDSSINGINDKYVACTNCNNRVEEIEATCREEFLLMRYDNNTNSASKVMALFGLLMSGSVIAGLHLKGGAAFGAVAGLTALGYFTPKFLPLKARGIVNLIAGNVKLVFGSIFFMSIFAMIIMAVVESSVGKGTLSNVINSGVALLTYGGWGYLIYSFNKDNWALMKETWALLDLIENAPPPEEEQVQKEAA